MDYKELVKTLTDSDYELVFTYQRIDECSEVIRHNTGGSLRDMPQPVKATFNNNIYFTTKSDGLNPVYMAKEVDGKFQLFELTYKTYCKLGF